MLKAVFLLAGSAGILAAPFSTDTDDAPLDLEADCLIGADHWNHGCHDNNKTASVHPRPSDTDDGRFPGCDFSGGDGLFDCLRGINFGPEPPPKSETITTTVVVTDPTQVKTTTVTETYPFTTSTSETTSTREVVTTTVVVEDPTQTSVVKTSTVIETLPFTTSTARTTASTTTSPPRTSTSSGLSSSSSSSELQSSKTSSQTRSTGTSFTKTSSSTESASSSSSSLITGTTTSSRELTSSLSSPTTAPSTSSSRSLTSSSQPSSTNGPSTSSMSSLTTTSWRNSTALPTSTVAPTKTSEPAPTSTGKDPHQPGRQPCTEEKPTALKEREERWEELKRGWTPEFREEVKSHNTPDKNDFILSEMVYQVKALEDDAFKPRALEPWYTTELRANPSYRAMLLDDLAVRRLSQHANDKFGQEDRKTEYEKLLRSHYDLWARTVNAVRRVVCQHEAALKGGEFLPGLSRQDMEGRLNEWKVVERWMMAQYDLEPSVAGSDPSL